MTCSYCFALLTLSCVPAYTFPGYQYTNQWGTKMTDDELIGLLQVRPFMIALTATYWYTYSYASTPVFSCRTDESLYYNTTNHAVFLVGYTATYWIVKNSWGTTFGDNGYIYVTRPRENNCGIGFEIVNLVWSCMVGYLRYSFEK